MTMTCPECETEYDITGKTDWNCPVCHPKKVKKWRAENKEKVDRYVRKSHFKECYGITIEEYDQMLLKQGGVCAICKQPPGKRRLAVDHCHTTQNIRSLLCTTCNVGLGSFKDDPKLLEAAIEYLKKGGS